MDVARLLLDHGAQVNMPADSFESPLTLAACGGHLDLAALLISRGANLEEVNDEGYEYTCSAYILYDVYVYTYVRMYVYMYVYVSMHVYFLHLVIAVEYCMQCAIENG